ncbi:MAG: SpoIID/LytB domain-containing protein [Acidimicrobiales bacterium]
MTTTPFTGAANRPPGPGRFWRRAGTRTVTSLLAMAMVLGVTAGGTASPAAAATTDRTITITGRGWGHGRGLSQYGAYGYARDHGWSSAQILDHYYGGTSGGPAPANGPVNPSAIRVELRSVRDRHTEVALTSGAIKLVGLDGADLGTFGDGAVRIRWATSRFEVDVATPTSSTNCGPNWRTVGAIEGRTTVRIQAQSSASGADGLLRVCGPSSTTWYRGEVQAVRNGGVRTVNVLPAEEYLRGVVPNEMPSSWPGPAVEAQAVAARSYALAGDSRQQPYADTCDSTLCQVYDGAYTTRGGSFRTASASASDAAIAATANLVRIDGSGGVARTEFSSSSGGWTAGGTFPAVEDLGDAIDRNPNHTWSVTLDAASIESLYGKGRLTEIAVLERTGAGADGGRVVRAELRFANGTVSVTGDSLRSSLGLKSNWFTPGSVADPASRDSAAGQYVDRTYQRLAGRPATDGEIVHWHDAVAAGNRLALTGPLVRSDYFVGRIVDDLYQRALGRGPDPSGRSYWVNTVRGGLKIEATGVLFYGSQEYYLRSGATNGGFVDALYRDLLGRGADPSGRAYWVGQLDSRRARLDDVVAGFYRSLESRRDRAVALHLTVRGVDPGGARDVLADRLFHVDDLVVAAEIAASPEA